MHSAKHYRQKEDAAQAGRDTGSMYAFVLLAAIAVICITSGRIRYPPMVFALLAAFVLRIGMEVWMEYQWEFYQRKRVMLMKQGVTSQDAFDAIRQN